MLLLIDAGNTRVKWAVPAQDMFNKTDSQQARWLYEGSAEHGHLSTLVGQWTGLSVTRVVIANVAGVALREALEGLLVQAFGAHVAVTWFASVAQLCGVENGYKDPAQLGCDRFATLIGVRALFADQACVVATCGTATTVDTLTADGRFIGGMILPGLGMMATALSVNTAQLPKVEAIHAMVTPFANNTIDAIVSGCIAAQAGAIERVLTAHAQTYGEVRCILAGGAGKVVASHLHHPYTFVDNLVLVGLHVVTSARS